MQDILDGASNTLAIGERPPNASMDVGWWYTTHREKPAFWEYELATESGFDRDHPECVLFTVRMPDGSSFGKFYFAPASPAEDCPVRHAASGEQVRA